MRIALDYDNTYTRDPELWNKFIADSFALGHEICCVTMRASFDFIPWPPEFCILVIKTAGKAKVPFCEALGVKVDIWIDDQPYRLTQDAFGG